MAATSDALASDVLGRASPEDVARALLAELGVGAPWEIAIALIAARRGAYVEWRDTGGADARLVWRGDAAFIAVDRAARGTVRARFSIAHELAHFLLHAGYDGLERIHGGGPLTGRDFQVEAEADRFASEVLVPAFLAAPICATAAPTLDAVGGLARRFDVSLTVAARKWAQLAETPCAFVEARGGVIKRPVRSTAFRGSAVQRRKLEEGTLALDATRGARDVSWRVHRVAWGAAALGREIVEECVAFEDDGGDGVVLSWLHHAEG
jgi:Zn-dependent peptidase ImmA (M78 family)